MIRAADLEAGCIRPLAPHEFDLIRQLAHRTFGLDLKPGKEELVAARLRPILRSGGFRSFREYHGYVVADGSGEALKAMIDALATNHTSFLREPEHFDFLRNQVAPRLAGRDSVEVWSAACSSGEEAWTLACVLNESLPTKQIRIEATDISYKALGIAERALYTAERCEALPRGWLSRYFVLETGPAKAWAAGPQVRSQVRFRRFNLLEPLARTRLFPVIFCRNVMIYFDAATQEQVVRKLTECLEPGGYLFVGHAESLMRVPHSLEYVRPAVYRKPENKEGWRIGLPKELTQRG
jgi:chemotaxis protein methyltransferase CheR